MVETVSLRMPCVCQRVVAERHNIQIDYNKTTAVLTLLADLRGQNWRPKKSDDISNVTRVIGGGVIQIDARVLMQGGVVWQGRDMTPTVAAGCLCCQYTVHNT